MAMRGPHREWAVGDKTDFCHRCFLGIPVRWAACGHCGLYETCHFTLESSDSKLSVVRKCCSCHYEEEVAARCVMCLANVSKELEYCLACTSFEECHDTVESASGGPELRWMCCTCVVERTYEAKRASNAAPT